MHLIYRLDDAGPVLPPPLPAGVAARVWRPSWGGAPPAAIRDPKHWVWWAFHNLRVFANRDFGVVLLERDGRLVHRSGVFPGFFRFPFMAPDDLQIGDTWTAPEARGQGLAGLAIGVARAAFGRAGVGRRFWYLTESENRASITVAERQGFALVAPGRRLPRAGFAILGYYTPAPGSDGASAHTTTTSAP
jgi:RimJ/RimL family protein N-acetyltransferase